VPSCRSRPSTSRPPPRGSPASSPTGGAAARRRRHRNLDAIRAAVGYWHDQAWLATDPTRSVRRRGRAPDRAKALSRAAIEALLAREDVDLRERTLWRLL
jgi:site-specific recombinase XerD